MPLKGFVQDASPEELAIAPVVECLTTTGWQNYHQQISSKQHHGHFAKNSDFLWRFPGRRVWECCSTKGAAHCLFHRAFWNKLFGKALLVILSVFEPICLSITFLFIFTEFLRAL